MASPQSTPLLSREGKPITSHEEFEADKKHRIHSFLEFCRELPLELLMLVINRSQGISDDIIPYQDREIAFKTLAASFDPPS